MIFRNSEKLYFFCSTDSMWIFQIAGKCRITFSSFMCKTNFTTINQVNDCRDREVYKTFCCSCCCCSAFNHCSLLTPKKVYRIFIVMAELFFISCSACYDIFFHVMKMSRISIENTSLKLPYFFNKIITYKPYQIQTNHKYFFLKYHRWNFPYQKN